MKNPVLLFTIVAVMAIVSLSFRVVEDLNRLEIGAEAPLTGLEMEDAISGVNYTLNGIKGKNGLLVMFSCNTCPWVLAWEDRYDDIAKLCAANEVGFIVINSNEGQRNGVDSKSEMKARAKEMNYTFPYVIDKNHALADAFGATRTPDLFLFDGMLKLRYTGAIDDNAHEPESVSEKYIENAIAKMVAGKPIDPNATKSLGCSIKRLKS